MNSCNLKFQNERCNVFLICILIRQKFNRTVHHHIRGDLVWIWRPKTHRPLISVQNCVLDNFIPTYATIVAVAAAFEYDWNRVVD